MNKKIIITTLLALVALTGWAQKQNKYTISGDLSVMTPGGGKRAGSLRL